MSGRRKRNAAATGIDPNSSQQPKPKPEIIAPVRGLAWMRGAPKPEFAPVRIRAARSRSRQASATPDALTKECHTQVNVSEEPSDEPTVDVEVVDNVKETIAVVETQELATKRRKAKTATSKQVKDAPAVREASVEIIDEPVAPSRSDRPRRKPSVAVPVTVSSAPKKTKRKKEKPVETIEYLLTNTKSRLASCDMKSIINFDNFMKLSAASQQKILKTLPICDYLPRDIYNTETLIQHADAPQFDPTTLRYALTYNTSLQEGFLTFQNRLYSGMFTSEYQEWKKEQNAVEDGEDEEFWKDMQFEETWGDKSVDQNVINFQKAGESKNVSLVDLFKQQLIRPNDKFMFSKTFQKQATTVSSEFTLVSCDGKLFTLKRGSDKPVLIDRITSLERIILDLDRRIPFAERPNGNTWKCIRVVRGGQDIGKLFDLRMEAYKNGN